MYDNSQLDHILNDCITRNSILQVGLHWLLFCMMLNEGILISIKYEFTVLRNSKAFNFCFRSACCYANVFV